MTTKEVYEKIQELYTNAEEVCTELDKLAYDEVNENKSQAYSRVFDKVENAAIALKESISWMEAIDL